MRYTLTAAPGLDNELALIWLQASDKDAVTQAANEIDSILKTSPLTWGKDFGDFLTLTIGPLTAAYTVSEEDRKVYVYQFIYHG